MRLAPVWPYGTTPAIVLSSSPPDGPDALASLFEHMQGTPAELVARWQARGWQHVYVDGGRTMQELLATGLTHRLVLNLVPVLIGDGRPLFGAVPADLWLEHVGTTAYPGGLVQSEYVVRRIGP